MAVHEYAATESVPEERPEDRRRTTRMPTHDSAILTNRLSCAHFLAAETSLRARSVRFCCRCIWVIRAILFAELISAIEADRGLCGRVDQELRTLRDFPDAC